jgi:hypothetical protein
MKGRPRIFRSVHIDIKLLPRELGSTARIAIIYVTHHAVTPHAVAQSVDTPHPVTQMLGIVATVNARISKS